MILQDTIRSILFDSDFGILINHVFYRKLIKMLSKYFTTDTRKIIDVMEAMEYKPVENRFANMSKKYICYMQIVQTSLWT